MLLGDDEKVDRGVGVNIFEYESGLILIKNLSRLFSANDLTENTVLFHC